IGFDGCCIFRYDTRDMSSMFFFFFQAEDGIRDRNVTGVQTCALPISGKYLADYLELQKMRIRAFLEQQCRWREEKFEELDQSVLEAMAGFYFRSLQSAIVRSISHGDGRREIFDWLEQEMEDPLYGLLKDHLTGGKAVKI